MAKNTQLKNAIKEVVKTNGVQGIRGNNLQASLLRMVDTLGAGFQFGGQVIPTSTFPVDSEGVALTDQNWAFLASTPGRYTNFGNILVESGQVAVLLWDGIWRKQVVSYYANTEVYGVRHFYTNASPDLTRIGSADLHRNLPIQSQMSRCIVDDLGVVKYYLHPDNSALKADGTAADLSGADGQFMVEIPRHYRRISLNQNGGYMDAEISLYPFDGCIAEPRRLVSVDEAVLDRQDNKLCAIVNTDARYRGGYNQADWDGTYRDLRGKPVTNITRATFRSAARARGSRWSCYDYSSHLCIFWLFTIEYATLNSQKDFNASLTTEGYHQGGLGPGVSTMSDWGTYNDYNPFIPCGFTNSLGNHTGVVTWTNVGYSQPVPSYRGIANPFGHLWKITDGFIGQGVGGNYQEVYVCRNPDKYADSITSDYTDIGPAATSDGYCLAIFSSYQNLSPSLRPYGDIFSRSNSGSASTFFCDYHWYGRADGSLYLLLLGGLASYGFDGGLACVNALYGVGDASQVYGSRLVWSE